MSIAFTKALRLINLENDLNLLESQVAIDEVVVNTDLGVARNTKARLVGQDGFAVNSSIPIWYNRLDLTKLFTSVPVCLELETTAVSTSNMLIPLINQRYGTDFEVGDFVQQPLQLTTQQEPTHSVTLVVKEDNPAYVGEFLVNYGLVTVNTEGVALNTSLT